MSFLYEKDGQQIYINTTENKIKTTKVKVGTNWKKLFYVFVDEVQGNSIIFILAPKHVHLQFSLYINKYKINHDQLFAWLLYVLDLYYLRHSEDLDYHCYTKLKHWYYLRHSEDLDYHCYTKLKHLQMRKIKI